MDFQCFIIIIFIEDHQSYKYQSVIDSLQYQKNTMERQVFEHESDGPQMASRPKRSNNKNKEDKVFICKGDKCGKAYISYVSWHAHFKSKHDKDSKQSQKILLHDMQELNRRINPKPEVERIVQVQDIPTFNQEYLHKRAADETYAKICAEWKRLKPTLRQGNIQDVVFNRFTDRVQGRLYHLRDIPRLRREMLRKEVTNLVEEYRLQHLQNSVLHLTEFDDYQLLDNRLNRRATVNFCWDLFKYFRPVFAAKLQVMLYKICHQHYNLFNANQSPSFNRFEENEWSKYSFIDSLLSQYHQSWQATTGNPSQAQGKAN